MFILNFKFCFSFRSKQMNTILIPNLEVAFVMEFLSQLAASKLVAR
jgi:hypothetical protein